MATERGVLRRAALLDAAAGLLEADGFAALTHRAVAARAGVPLASTTYYFASHDELVEDALRRLAEVRLAHGRALVESLPRRPPSNQRLAGILVAVITGHDQRADDAHLLTFYERYVQAGRRPRLQPLVRSWNAEVIDLVRETLRRSGRSHRGQRPRLVMAAVDGLLVGLLVEGGGDALPAARAGLTRLLADLPR